MVLEGGNLELSLSQELCAEAFFFASASGGRWGGAWWGLKTEIYLRSQSSQDN